MAGKPDTVTLRGYAHIKLITAGATEILVAGASGNLNSNVFGSVLVVDDPLQLTTDGGSELVGRIKGIGANTDLVTNSNNTSLYLTFLIDYKGVAGSVAVQGTSIKTDKVRPFAIVGGTGAFQLARGIATQETLSQGFASNGSLLMVNEWRLTFYQDLLGPKIHDLRTKFADLVEHA